MVRFTICLTMSVASKLLPKLVYWNTRLVVGTYTAVSLPFYTIAQRPWKQLRLARQKRVVVEQSLDGSTYWTRYGPPVTHPNGYHNHSTFKEIVQMMKSKEDLTVPKLAHRALFCEKVLYDDNGLLFASIGDRFITEISLSLSFSR